MDDGVHPHSSLVGKQGLKEGAMTIDLEQFVPEHCHECDQAPEGMDYHNCGVCYAHTILNAIEDALDNDKNDDFMALFAHFCDDVIPKVVDKMDNPQEITDRMMSLNPKLDKHLVKMLGAAEKRMGFKIPALRELERMLMQAPPSPYLN